MAQQSNSNYLRSLAAISELEAADLKQGSPARVRELRLVCRDAAAIELRKREAGAAPSQPEAWPDSTRAFLRRHAERRRAR